MGRAKEDRRVKTRTPGSTRQLPLPIASRDNNVMDPPIRAAATVTLAEMLLAVIRKEDREGREVRDES